MSELFQHSFMLRALVVGAAAGLTCPLAGVFLVFRRYSFLADTLAHVGLAAVAASFWLGLTSPPALLLATAATALGTSLLAEKVRAAAKLSGESVLALLASTGLALAVVFFGRARFAPLDLTACLFGSILTVTPGEARLMLGVAAGVSLLVLALSKELFFLCCDEEAAAAAGLPVDALKTAFLGIVALSVAVGLRLVGALLVGNLMVVPVLAAALLARSFRQLLVLAVSLGLAASLGGLALAYAAGIAAGGAVALTSLALFLLAFLARGLPRRS